MMKNDDAARNGHVGACYEPSPEAPWKMSAAFVHLHRRAGFDCKLVASRPRFEGRTSGASVNATTKKASQGHPAYA